MLQRFIYNFKSFVAKSNMKTSTQMSSDDYDVVRVDLSDDRDYPIYIGADFDDKEGLCLCLCSCSCSCYYYSDICVSSFFI